LASKAANIEFGGSEGFGDFRESGAALVGRKAPDDGAVIWPMLFEKKVDNFCAAIVRKIDIDVGQFIHGHAIAVEKSPKVEVKADWAYS
jgi:hypothetical protein